MTLDGTSGRIISKTAAVAILLGGIWLGVSVLVWPLVTRYTDARDQIEQERVLLGRLLEEARTLTSQTTAQDADPDQSLLLPPGSEAEKTAALQTRIEQVAAAAQVQLKSLQPSGEQTQGPLQIMGIRAVASGSIDKLQAFLHALEAGRPGLIITSLDVAPPVQERDSNGVLDMRLSVSGAARPGTGVQP
jgi:hypothetical protein